jgi:TPR repeat protein
MLRTLLVFVLLAAAGFAQATDFAETKKKAEAGDAVAQYRMSFIYATGMGVTSDGAEANKWARLANENIELRRKAEAGDEKAQYSLGTMLLFTWGNYQDPGSQKPSDEALTWYEKAAERGSARAQYQLALIYKGSYPWMGNAKNAAEAAKWLKKAADQGLIPAQNSLSHMYQVGGGVPKDYETAFNYMRRAADQGDANSQNSLGSMYFRGEVVPKDLVQAHVWYNIAGANGDEGAKESLGFVEKEMTSDQKAEAMKLARDLFAKLPKGK